MELDALNSSLTALRNDVRDLQSTQTSLTVLRHEVDDLKASFLSLRQDVSDGCRADPAAPELHREIHELHESLSVLRRELQSMKLAQLEMMHSTLPKFVDSDFPPLTTCTAENHSPVRTNGGQLTQAHTSVQLSRPTQLERTRSTDVPRTQSHPVPETTRQTRRTKTVLGRNNQSTLKPASARQSRIHMFVTRLSTETMADDVSETVRRALLTASGGTIEPLIECEALHTKHDSYVSFHITVGVQPATKDSIIATLNSADTWPDGVLVRRYFINNKHG